MTGCAGAEGSLLQLLGGLLDQHMDQGNKGWSKGVRVSAIRSVLFVDRRLGILYTMLFLLLLVLQFAGNCIESLQR